MLAIQPEGRSGNAVLQIHQQVCELALGKTFLQVCEAIDREAAQGADLFRIVLWQAFDSEPEQGTSKSQGTLVGGFLF
ncbi:hypothetical protein D9M68_783600 [compost metagenome]